MRPTGWTTILRDDDPASDADLALLRGDDDAMQRVIARWLPQLYAWCGRLGAHDPQEAATDVALLLVRRRASIHGADHLPRWLFVTCRRVVANQRKRAWWRRWIPGVAVEAWAAPERTDLPSERREVADRVAAALDTLAPHHREVLVLCYIEERSVQETAELLDVPPGTVKSRLFNARARFERAYGEDDHG